MLGNSSARIRQIFTIFCLSIIFILALIIMGSVGVNGQASIQNLERGCLLYMSINDGVATFNNGFCLFPIVGAAVVSLLALIFLLYWIMVVYQKDEFAPKPMTILFLTVAASCALLSFAICGEIGIGLSKGCMVLGENNQHCRSMRHFNGKRKAPPFCFHSCNVYYFTYTNDN
jgi:hypothetical protein